jgi:putative ABC transport system permease protein
MAEAVRERTNEIAVLKTLGFSGAKVLSLILCEAVVIVSIGAFLGIAITFLIFNGLDIKLDAYLPGVTLSYHTFLKGLVMAVFIGVATGVLPAFKAFKLDVATALRRL